MAAFAQRRFHLRAEIFTNCSSLDLSSKYVTKRGLELIRMSSSVVINICKSRLKTSSS